MMTNVNIVIWKNITVFNLGSIELATVNLLPALPWKLKSIAVAFENGSAFYNFKIIQN